MTEENGFGKLLRKIRKTTKMSAKELAEKSDLPELYVGHIERGECEVPAVRIILKLSEVLGYDPRFLLGAAFKQDGSGLARFKTDTPQRIRVLMELILGWEKLDEGLLNEVESPLLYVNAPEPEPGRLF